jgi:signal transduction histidine kinase
VQRKYHALLARERGAKEELERKVLERTEALRRAQDQLVLNEKMSSLGRLVAGIAHELNNPINFVYGNVDFLAQYFRHLINLIAIYEAGELTEEARRKARDFKESIDFEFLMEDWERLLKSVRAGAERTAQIVAGLKAFSRPHVGRLEETDILAGLETTLHLLQPLLRDRVTVQRSFAPVPRIQCRGGQVQQVFMNLLTNAAQAAGPGGTIFLDARPDSAGVRVSVRDTGPGVPAELATKIFDPFFTTKDVGEGTGLGLAISQRIVRSHGGRIELSPTPPGAGAEFVVWLPRVPPPEPKEKEAE